VVRAFVPEPKGGTFGLGPKDCLIVCWVVADILEERLLKHAAEHRCELRANSGWNELRREKGSIARLTATADKDKTKVAGTGDDGVGVINPTLDGDETIITTNNGPTLQARKVVEDMS
jgi:hypothetical protein